jgi:hypothetical protein
MRMCSCGRASTKNPIILIAGITQLLTHFQIKSLGYVPSLEGFDGKILSNEDILDHLQKLQARDGYVLTNVFFRKA